MRKITKESLRCCVGLCGTILLKKKMEEVNHGWLSFSSSLRCRGIGVGGRACDRRNRQRKRNELFRCTGPMFRTLGHISVNSPLNCPGIPNSAGVLSLKYLDRGACVSQFSSSEFRRSSTANESSPFLLGAVSGRILLGLVRHPHFSTPDVARKRTTTLPRILQYDRDYWRKSCWMVRRCRIRGIGQATSAWITDWSVPLTDLRLGEGMVL
jgi:hypothetical protein